MDMQRGSVVGHGTCASNVRLDRSGTVLSQQDVISIKDIEMSIIAMLHRLCIERMTKMPASYRAWFHPKKIVGKRKGRRSGPHGTTGEKSCRGLGVRTETASVRVREKAQCRKTRGCWGSEVEGLPQRCWRTCSEPDRQHAQCALRAQSSASDTWGCSMHGIGCASASAVVAQGFARLLSALSRMESRFQMALTSNAGSKALRGWQQVGSKGVAARRRAAKSNIVIAMVLAASGTARYVWEPKSPGSAVAPGLLVEYTKTCNANERQCPLYLDLEKFLNSTLSRSNYLHGVDNEHWVSFFLHVWVCLLSASRGTQYSHDLQHISHWHNEFPIII
ncbi:hypothetical protein GGX14DRAFT_396024 [Mycena pura]|uniref:Uncharacterized protein n=1 Tax=Mycena pura TaxID=153505 RepID=A0AAD6VEQ6_9AGAR|nr:hypothetical protein GGX14DRAFT_396024 [Mycena pura]